MTTHYPNTGKPPRNKTIPLGIEFECGHWHGGRIGGGGNDDSMTTFDD